MKNCIKIIFSVLCFATVFFCSGFVSASMLPSAPPIIRVSPENFYPAKEVLYLEGSAVPHAAVSVVVSGSNGDSFNFQADADGSGNWVFSKSVAVPPGVYEMKARQSAGNMLSGWSAPKTVRAFSSGMSFFGVNFLYGTLAIFVAFMGILLALAHLYFQLKLKTLRRWGKK